MVLYIRRCVSETWLYCTRETASCVTLKLKKDTCDYPSLFKQNGAMWPEHVKPQKNELVDKYLNSSADVSRRFVAFAFWKTWKFSDLLNLRNHASVDMQATWQIKALGDELLTQVIKPTVKMNSQQNTVNDYRDLSQTVIDLRRVCLLMQLFTYFMYRGYFFSLWLRVW